MGHRSASSEHGMERKLEFYYIGPQMSGVLTLLVAGNVKISEQPRTDGCNTLTNQNFTAGISGHSSSLRGFMLDSGVFALRSVRPPQVSVTWVHPAQRRRNTIYRCTTRPCRWLNLF